MIYTMKAHPTIYKGTQFRSRLEARWAAFADIVGWKWEYEPIDLDGWTPDFKFTLPCKFRKPCYDFPWHNRHIWSECWHEPEVWCQEKHELYAEVKPYTSLEQFAGHAVKRFDPHQHPAPAMFGNHPDITRWAIRHGSELEVQTKHGSVVYWLWEYQTSYLYYLMNAEDLDQQQRLDVVNWAWAEAGNRTRYQAAA